jgi:endonuclease/exonuclease/phosphatase family metal-dependent hydrolase
MAEPRRADRSESAQPRTVVMPAETTDATTEEVDVASAAAHRVPEPGSGPRHLRVDAPEPRPNRVARLARVIGAWVVVVPFVAWVVARLAGWGQGTRFETLVVFTPYVAAASVVALAVALVLRVRLAVLAAALCCVGFGVVMIPAFVGSSGPDPAPVGPVATVMTVNALHGEADPEELVEIVREHDVSLLAVQELSPALHEALDRAGLDELLPDRVVDVWVGGLGLYADRPLARLDVEHGVGGDVLAARLLPRGAPPVAVSVVHTSPPRGRGGRAEWRATIDTIDPPDRDGPLRIALGDFNGTLDQPTIRGLLDDGFVDAARTAGRGWVPTWRQPWRPPLTLDHVFVDPTMRVDGVDVIDVDGTDHRAVLARLRLPAA